jgi:hypothetical protein
VPGGDDSGVICRQILQRIVVAVYPRQARAGGFVERNSELRRRICVHNGFVNVFHCFDEVALPENQIDSLGDL